MRPQIFSQLCSRQLRMLQHSSRKSSFAKRLFHASVRRQVIKPFLLADIGEGIRECEIIQWFVEPEARVEEWDKLCEVQSDKASVEITSRFAGVIKKLHYDAGNMAKVGQPLLDIDIQGDIKDKDLAALTGESPEVDTKAPVKDIQEPLTANLDQSIPQIAQLEQNSKPKGTHATLATPAVRHLTKELNVKITDINGTGRDGRVLKDDVYQFAKHRDLASSSNGKTSSPLETTSGPQIETVTQLSNIQSQMFKSMTRSLTIPHFLYADEVNVSELSELRQRLNKTLSKSPVNDITKLSYLPFVIKAISMMLHQYPTLNARVDVDQNSSKPVLVMRSQHNIGVAMDTPTGLIVPVIKNVSSLNILSIAGELSRLQSLAAAGKLASQDLSGGTITVSNIGSIGGTYVSPVIVEKEVAILGIGKMRTVPAFDEQGQLVRKQACNFSWSADHRVIDGATMARAAELVRGFLEDPDSMVIHLR
ncbi:2-oxoacid dehydrogenases acyltransferase-domain-containing protein [Bisporella sp. PMI_857]|nr:2-oxoacid dehydrogenases acyltransferase-domain-containing protein [Bisporella sp. PMI_857]